MNKVVKTVKRSLSLRNNFNIHLYKTNYEPFFTILMVNYAKTLCYNDNSMQLILIRSSSDY